LILKNYPFSFKGPASWGSRQIRNRPKTCVAWIWCHFKTFVPALTRFKSTRMA